MNTRITDVEIRNVLKCKYVHLDPADRSLTIIGGKNDQGKTSVLSAIAMALGGARLCPDEPIRSGEDYAEVKVDLSESETMPACTVHRQWFRRPDGSIKTCLDIISKDEDATEEFGYSKSARPQGMLDDLINKVSFDPLEFMRKSPKDQAKALRELIGLDFTEIDAEIAALEKERYAAKKSVDDAESVARSIRVPAWEGERPPSPQEVVDLLQAMSRRNAERNQRLASRNMWTQNRDSMLKEIDSLKARIEKLTAEVQKIDEALSLSTDGLEPEDASSLEKLFKKAQDWQAVSQMIDQKNVAEIRAAEFAAKAASVQRDIEELRKSKLEMVAKASWPIDGLGFTEDGGLTFNGFPFSQSSTAVQIKTSVAIGLALNPRMKLMLVREGSLLDNESLLELAKCAAEGGGQVFLERVSEGDECHIVMKDGEVVKQEREDSNVGDTVSA